MGTDLYRRKRPDHQNGRVCDFRRSSKVIPKYNKINKLNNTKNKITNYKLIFWLSTGLFSAFMLFSAFGYLTMEEMKGAFINFGFPADSFRIQLAITKVLGVAALLLPFVPKTLKGLAYAGFSINLVSALIAHITNGYHAYGFIIFATITLAISYYSYLKVQNSLALLRQEV